MRRRLLIGYLSLTALTLAALVVPLGTIFASRERNRLLQDIEHDADLVAGLVEEALEEGTSPPIGAFLDAYTRRTGGRVVVVDASGTRVAGDAPAPGEAPDEQSELAAALQEDRVLGAGDAGRIDDGAASVAVPVVSGERVLGAVLVAYPASTLAARVRSTWVQLGLASFGVLVLATVLGDVLARSVTRPVRRLQEAARAIAAGELAARAPDDHGPPEIRELAATFNATAAHLEDLVHAQEAFVADASHQLRTPLAAMRLRLENLEDTVPARDQPQIAALRAETARLARLSESLLALARATGRRPAAEPVDAAAVIRERLEHWEAAAAACDATLVVRLPDRAVCRVPLGVLEQVLDNLIANALEVSPRGGAVTVLLRREDDGWALHVADEGPGLGEEHRRRAFDRFWRAPDAPPGGSGLGLAIVKELVSASGGTAVLRESPSGGVDAIVTVPPG